jgi:hypothetical protein
MSLPFSVTLGPGIDIGGGISIVTPSVLVIPLNSDGGTTGWSAVSASIPYSSTVIGKFPVGSIIRFQDNTTSTIDAWDPYPGGGYIDIFWVGNKSGTIFPITLTSV